MPIDPKKLKSNGLNPVEPLDISKELEEHREILLKIYANTRKTRRYIMISKVLSIIYFLLIVVPIILAVIYLPPLVRNIVGPYQDLLGPANELIGIEVDIINDILNQLGKYV